VSRPEPVPATVPGAVAGPSPAGDDVIHDIGFRHYDGVRYGRPWVRRSLFVETVRGIFGLGRPARAKVMPWVLIGMLGIPPLIIALVVVLTGQTELPMSYTDYPSGFWLVVALFVGGAAPYCVSRDLRHGVMPLYLSRPMARSDYVVAKFAGLTLALFGVMAIGETLLLIGALLAELPPGDQLTGWLGGLLVCALLSVLLSAIALVIAAFTPRRGLGVAVIITALVMVSGITEMLIEIAREKDLTTLAQYMPALDPFGLIDALAVGILGVSSGREHILPEGALGVIPFALVWAALVAGCLWLLVRRYRKAGRV